MKKRLLSMLLGLAMVATLLTGCDSGAGNPGDTSGNNQKEEIPKDSGPTVTDWTVSYDGIKKGTVSARVSVHDPSIIQVEDKYYIFGSHMETARGTNLRSWSRLGNGYSSTNSIYGNLWDTSKEVFKYAGARDSLIPTDDGGTHVWAPDVCYNPTTGLYYLYYCTTSTWNASNLCYATSENVEGPYEWQGALIYSGFDSTTIKQTDVYDVVSESYAKSKYLGGGHSYNFRDYPNAIDPSIFFDEDGRWWMVYGSWSGGIFLLEIDKATGQIIHPKEDLANGVDDYYGKRLVGGMHHAIEGPHIEYDKESGYYYLFVSYGGLERMGGYQIRVYRSEKVDGPYVDMKGNTVWEEENIQDFGVKLMGNYTLPNLNAAYMAPGGQSAYTDDDGKKYVVYHQRFDLGTEYHEPRVHQYFINEEGWPVVAPHATSNEKLSEKGYDASVLEGTFYLLNHGSAVDAAINEPVEVQFENGTISGGMTGTYSVTKGTNFAQITIDGVTYKGVLVEMLDDTNNPTFNFTGIGSNNQSLWGVRYIETLQAAE